MKKLFLYSLLPIGMVLGGGPNTSAQVSVHIGGVIGGNPGPVYQGYPVYQNYPVNLPPGQAKKLYGTKSAKYFAPGHAKKSKHFKPYYNEERQYKVYRAPDVYEVPSRHRVIIDAQVRL
jgi:hypothetical protein